MKITLATILILGASIFSGSKACASIDERIMPKYKIAFVSGRDGNPEIYIMNSDGTDPRRLTSNDNCDGLCFEESILNSNGMGVENPRLSSRDGSLLWSPDGKKIVFKSGQNFYDMNRDGTDQEKVGGGDYACFSPDGKSIALAGSQLMYILNSDGSGQRILKPAWNPIFLPDGEKIVCGSELSGFDGIYLVTIDGRNITRLTPNDSKYWGQSLSPNGKQIAFYSVKDGNPEIYTMNIDGSGMNKLTNNPGSDEYPVWSPDGRYIAFTSNRDGNYEIYLVDPIDGSMKNITRNSANDWVPRWSPDGKKLAFETDRDGNFEIYVINADGSDLKRLTYHPAWDGNPVWSPLPIENQADSSIKRKDSKNDKTKSN